MNICYSTSSPAWSIFSSILFLLSFLSFNFNLGRLFYFIFNLISSFLISIQYADERIEDSLQFCYNVVCLFFAFSIPFWFLDYPPLCFVLPTYSWMLSTFSFRALKHMNHSCLNIMSDNLKYLCHIEFISDAGFLVHNVLFLAC